MKKPRKPKSGWISIGLCFSLLGALAVHLRRDIPVQKLLPRYTNDQSRFMEIRGMKVHYRDEGRGFPIVLLHGAISSLHTWDRWSAELAKEYRVIRMDLPGSGLTGPEPDGIYTISTFNQFLQAFLDQLQIGSCHIIGNSLGGYIAWEFALAYPERIRKMVLIDAAGYNLNRPPIIFKAARLPVVKYLWRYITPRYMVKWIAKKVYGQAGVISQETIDRYYDLFLRKGNRKAFIDLANVKIQSNTEELKQLDIPTLILWGINDSWIPAEDAYRFQSDLPHARLVLYNNTGHIPMEEMPQQSLADVKGFLKEASDGGV